MTYMLTMTAGATTLTCGNVTKNVTIIAYTPTFNQTTYSGTAGVIIPIGFSTNGLQQQITIGTTSLATTNTNYNANLTAGTYTITLQTMNTNPILSASASVNVAAPTAAPSITIITQPTPSLTVG